jgi:hypothetical protein
MDQKLKHANELKIHTIKKTQIVIWTKKRKREVKVIIILDYIISRNKSLVLEFEFITLKIESLDLDK